MARSLVPGKTLNKCLSTLRHEHIGTPHWAAWFPVGSCNPTPRFLKGLWKLSPHPQICPHNWKGLSVPALPADPCHGHWAQVSFFIHGPKGWGGESSLVHVQGSQTTSRDARGHTTSQLATWQREAKGGVLPAPPPKGCPPPHPGPAGACPGLLPNKIEHSGALLCQPVLRKVDQTVSASPLGLTAAGPELPCGAQCMLAAFRLQTFPSCPLGSGCRAAC